MNRSYGLEKLRAESRGLRSYGLWAVGSGLRKLRAEGLELWALKSYGLVVFLMFLLFFSFADAEAPTTNAVNVLEKVELSAAQESRAKALGNEIRCPVCRGVPIYESPADLARQLMLELRKQIQTGKSNDDIYSYFISRYGESILLSPPKKGINWLLWVFPVLMLLLGGYVWWNFFKPKNAPDALSPEDKDRIAALLKEQS